MENDGNPPSDATHELPSDIQLIVSQEGPGDAQAVAHADPSPTLEIVIDGSDLVRAGVGRDGLELSITFEKNNEEEGLQSELADQLDGVEVRVSLDSTQTVGVEVLSSRHGDRAVQCEDLSLALEGPHRDAWVLDAGTHALPAPNAGDQVVENDVPMESRVHTSPAQNSGNEFSGSNDDKEDCVPTLPKSDPHIGLVESVNAVENCNMGDANQSNEKKRPREELIDNDRCLKSKTLEDNKNEVLEKLAIGIMDPQEHPEPMKPCVEEVSVADSLNAENMKNSSVVVLEDHDTNGENLCESVRGTTGAVMEASDFEAKEVLNGLAMDDNTCIKESSEKATDASIDDSVHDKDNIVDDKGRERPRKKRKIAMLLAYCGAGYQGMQKNPGALTIEGELEQALAKAGAMPENFDGNPRKVDWMRAARTDKGVSAVGQVVSGLFYVDPPGFVERVNARLPEQIRLLGFKRVIPTFSAKKFCDRRRYEYVIPTFALDPSAHRDREAVLASEGMEGALIKCLECSERGRKVPAGKGSHKLLPNKVETGMDDVCNGQNPSAHGKMNENGTPCNSEQPHEESISLGSKLSTTAELANSALVLEEEEAKQSLDDVSEAAKEIFHFGEADRTKLNRLLNYYVGTHNFHNFTSRVKAEDPSAKRYMVSFEAGDVFTVRNMEFVRCTVVGQSFMLHQIRKMIGLVIAVFRGCAPESILETALRRDANITIPTAPELGLFLDECMYPAYNQKWYNTHEEVSQKGYEPEIRRFKHEVIYEHIAATEHKEGQMALFLHSLNDRNYADFAMAREAEKQLAQ